MTPAHLHRLLLQNGSWLGHFDGRTLERGADYTQRRRVTALEFSAADSDHVGTLVGHVRGGAQRPYRCVITITNEPKRLRLRANCTCPVQSDCKHAAAMLLLAANAPPSTWPGAGDIAPTSPPQPVSKATQAQLRDLVMRGDVDGAWQLLHARGRLPVEAEAADSWQWQQWLQGLADTPHDDTEPADARAQFGILLRSDEDSDQLLINPVWLRPGKSKRATLVAPKPLRLHERGGPQPAPPEGWPPLVSGALVALLHGPDHYVGSKTWIGVHADWQEQALETVLAHYPAFFERGSVPLVRGDNLTAQLRWVDQHDGSQKLEAHVATNEPAQLLRGASLWYVLPGSQRFGRVDGDVNLLDAVAHAPVLQPEQVDALRTQLAARDHGPPIPLPRERAPVELLDTVPVPVLQMREETLSIPADRYEPADSILLGCARLYFDYGGQLVRPGAIDFQLSERVMREGRVFEIQRDPYAEEEVERTLAKLGIVSAVDFARRLRRRKHAFADNDMLLQADEYKLPKSPEGWRPVLDKLSDKGFRIEYESSFPHDELVDIDDWYADIEPSGNAWFDVSLGIDVGGERIDLLPILRRVLADHRFPRQPTKGEKADATYRVLLDEKRSVEIPLQRLRALTEPLLEWIESDAALRLHRSQAPALSALAQEAQLVWRGGDALRQQLQLLASTERAVDAPVGFKAVLRPYQREGLAWLDFLGRAGLGGILADDMGLGKTVQVLAHILGEKQRGQLAQPALVVAPTSLVGNWRDEAARFAPDLQVLIIHGADRADRYDEIAEHDLVITTYPLLPRDREQLLKAQFSLLVLDEAQAIKNPSSQAAKVVRELPAARRLAMTGTPLENHLGELWAQFDAVEPGLLGSQRQFAKLYRTPIEKHADGERQQRLNRRIGPLLLRRKKDDVLTDLPAKTEIVHKLELADDQRGLYETLRLAQHERVRQTIKQRGLSQAGIIVLDALLKLRQACCDPRLVKLPSAKKVQSSAKLDALLELVEGLLDEGRRILLFSQFTEMLGLIEQALDKRRIKYQTLTGQTPSKDRTALVKRFQQEKVPLFLISLKAGGVGLNLTAADTVIHYDPWWNPAVETQATDRAHRIGQDKPVFVYKLIATGTVEEKIQALQARKAELARAVLEGGASQRLRFDEADLAELFAPL